MLRRDIVKSAVDDFLSAALLGGSWEASLERLSAAAGACGVSLVRVRNGRPLAWKSSREWAEADAELMHGHAPPSPRQLFPEDSFGPGFRVDHDLYTDAELSRDPYYQDFLKPRGAFWHAKVRLWHDADERISLSLKRGTALGPYGRADIAVLDSLVGELRAAVRVGRRVLDAEASGMVRSICRRERAAFELDSLGRVRCEHAAGPAIEEVRAVAGRLVAADALAQRSVDRAVMAAVTAPARPAAAVLPSESGEAKFLHIVPVVGEARDVFSATAAIAVVIDPGSHSAAVPVNFGGIRDVFGLTAREAQLAARLVQGMSIRDAARELRLGLGTARNHLKSIFAKSGTRRQGELIALLSRFCV